MYLKTVPVFSEFIITKRSKILSVFFPLCFYGFFFLGSYVVFTQSISFEILCLYVNKKSKAHLYLVAIYSAVKEAGRDTVCYGWPADMDKSSGLAMNTSSGASGGL